MKLTFQRIGFIGLGVMGEPICTRLARLSGIGVVGFDQDPASLARLVQHGVRSAASAGEVAALADLVFLSLPSGEVVAQVARAPGGLLDLARPGQVIVDLSTSSVDTTRELAAGFAARGARFVDAPVARTRAAAEAGTLSVMVGGERDVYNAVHPLIATFASEITHCGAVGCGQVMKILNNMILFEIGVALAEAKAIGTRSGVDPRLLFETLMKGSADSFALRNHGMKAMLPEDYPLRAFSVQYARKDLQYALRLANAVEVDARAARNVDELFERAIAAGHGDRYWPVVSVVVDGD